MLDDRKSISQTGQVDMMSSAKDAQWDTGFLDKGTLYKALAPAKVNLFLAVGTKDDSGYHKVSNIMQALALHDVLYVSHSVVGHLDERADPSDAQKADNDEFSEAFAGETNNIKVKIEISDKTCGIYDEPLKVPVKSNLVFKAIDALAKRLKKNSSELFHVRIEKNIPHQAGLGGGSSDAAAMLVVLAKAWGIDDVSLLEDVAKQLGADVAFFIKGGCALYSGYGDIFEHSLQSGKSPIVLVKTAMGISTKEAYQVFDEIGQLADEEDLANAVDAKAADEVELYNNLAIASESIQPELKIVKEWLEACNGVVKDNLGRAKVLLCGSGACTFAVMESFSAAASVVAEAKAKGYWARATTFANLRACAL